MLRMVPLPIGFADKEDGREKAQPFFATPTKAGRSRRSLNM
ncbi:MAG: hypothetical protein QOG84_194 [Sphingomonadales bacterium]|jgi:hypothetical protein|nr:hypothetical protein [Sphingomonadales bacterium]